MALKVKAVEKKIKFSKEDPGVYRYVMQPDLYIALSQAKVIKEAALRSIKECLSFTFAPRNQSWFKCEGCLK